MNKTDVAYIEGRVKETVACINGTLHSKTNQKIKETMYSDEEMLYLIRSGKATLKTDKSLTIRSELYNPSYCQALIFCFDYPVNPAHKQAEIQNKKHQDKLAELTHEVELAGKRIVDQCALDIIAKKDVPAALEKLSEMADLL